MTNEANTFDPTKPVQTRDGRKARIICTDRKGSGYPVLALVLNHDDGAESFEVYTSNGWYVRSGAPHDEDLINIPEPAKPVTNTPPPPTNGFDPAKPVQTRDGRKARILATDINRCNGDTIVAIITDDGGDEEPYTYRADGRYSTYGERGQDLINVPVSVTRYVHFFKSLENSFGTASYPTVATPQTSNTIGVLKVTVTGNNIEAVQVS